MSFESLLSPCAWLVKWHNCKCLKWVSDITEKFSLFCNFSASRNITTPAVNFGLLSLLLLLLLLMLKLWYYRTATIETLNCWTIEYCKELNKSVMKQSTCSAVICQPGGREQKHDNNKTDSFINHYSLGTLIITIGSSLIDNQKIAKLQFPIVRLIFAIDIITEWHCDGKLVNYILLTRFLQLIVTDWQPDREITFLAHWLASLYDHRQITVNKFRM